ncbi:TIGR03620 family F420-dependent LLM class oxidoreductase [Nocardia brasiliensis]|uniref:TIGR03620 family F420-dependent LLM class oxidoreductase n=1 Tax=Nocardia brasiliensis TaxID=37326 RepID=UPI0024562241|nr:TIGR03620 family F420-dependent LLM class oxidoreductase [Nocardia brasiliensis]
MNVDPTGRIAIWDRYGRITAADAQAAENLGYAALWLGGAPPATSAQVESALTTALEATTSLTIGSSIINIWSTPADQAAALFHRYEQRFPGRFLLGIGGGHPELTPAPRKPVRTLMEYLDALDRAGVPIKRRILAALGPRALELARERSAGSITYLATPEHTGRARKILGDDALLVSEQKIVLDTDPVRARQTARPMIEFYLELRNYKAHLARLGFAADATASGSDTVIDALVAHGTADRITRRVTAHLDAGADQVAVQFLARDHLAAVRLFASSLDRIFRERA